MNAAMTAGVCLALAGVTMAGPSFHIGTKLTWRGDAGSSGMVYDRFGEPVVIVNYDGEFVGATVEATYGPMWNVLSGRIDLYQIKVHTDYVHPDLVLFPMFGLDVMAEPPVDWRVKPYVWVGTRATAYITSFGPYPPEWHPLSAAHWCGGIGAKWRLTKRAELFAETQLYSNNIWRDGDGILREGTFTDRLSGVEVSGLVGAEVGVRFALGK